MQPVELMNLIQSQIQIDRKEENGNPNWNWDWVKWVSGINKSMDNGYSLMGVFTRKLNRLANHKPGLYLMYDRCDEPDQYNHWCLLFELHEDQTRCTGVEEIFHKADWAVRLWEFIEEWQASKTVSSEVRRQELKEKIAKLKSTLYLAECELQRLDAICVER